MKVLLADLTSQLITRYPQWMAETIYKDCEVEFIELSNITKCLAYIHDKKFNFDKIVIFGHRTPDLAFIFLARNIHSKVVFEYVQHGFFKPRLERSFWGSFILVFKKIYYLKWMFEVIKFSPIKGFVFFYFSILATFISGRFAGKALSHGKVTFSKLYLLNFDFREYFENFMNFNTLSYEEMPAFDSSRFSSEGKEYDVLIFAQTFVEDGRMPLNEYLKRINVYLSYLKSKNVCFFLHPRSNESIYKNLDCKIKINTFSIPKANIYLSDYSTLSLVAYDKGLKSYLLNISGHPRGKKFDKLQEFKIS